MKDKKLTCGSFLFCVCYLYTHDSIYGIVSVTVGIKILL